MTCNKIFKIKNLNEDDIHNLEDQHNWKYVFQYSKLSESFIEEMKII